MPVNEGGEYQEGGVGVTVLDEPTNGEGSTDSIALSDSFVGERLRKVLARRASEGQDRKFTPPIPIKLNPVEAGVGEKSPVDIDVAVSPALDRIFARGVDDLKRQRALLRLKMRQLALLSSEAREVNSGQAELADDDLFGGLRSVGGPARHFTPPFSANESL